MAAPRALAAGDKCGLCSVSCHSQKHNRRVQFSCQRLAILGKIEKAFASSPTLPPSFQRQDDVLRASLAHSEGSLLGCINEFSSSVLSSEELSMRSVCSAPCHGRKNSKFKHLKNHQDLKGLRVHVEESIRSKLEEVLAAACTAEVFHKKNLSSVSQLTSRFQRSALSAVVLKTISKL